MISGIHNRSHLLIEIWTGWQLLSIAPQSILCHDFLDYFSPIYGFLIAFYIRTITFHTSIHLLTFIAPISYHFGEPITSILGKYHCETIAYLSCHCNTFSLQNTLDFNRSTVTLYLGYNINHAILVKLSIYIIVQDTIQVGFFTNHACICYSGL